MTCFKKIESSPGVRNKPPHSPTLKISLSSPPVLTIYDPSWPTIVSSDALSYGLGAILLQLDEEAIPHPVAFASRTLTAADKHYDQIEKQALGIAWACEKFKNYIISLEFTIETNHEPFVPILSPKFSDDLKPRLQRFCMQLLRYNYKMRHIPGKDLVATDLLSRKLVHSPDNNNAKLESEVELHAINIIRSIPASSQMLSRIKYVQQTDTGHKLHEYIKNGWPKNRNELPENLTPYWQYQGSLKYEKGLILFAKRLWIPPPLRRKLLARLHESHRHYQIYCKSPIIHLVAQNQQRYRRNDKRLSKVCIRQTKPQRTTPYHPLTG